MAAEPGPVPVVDDAGLVRGSIDRTGIINALARQSRRAAEEATAP